MLEEKLEPILTKLSANQEDRTTNYQLVKAWFTQHRKNLSADEVDLAFLCTLPWHQRGVLTYPVIGNWYLDRVAEFDPVDEHQKTAKALLLEMIGEARFNNSHTKSLYATPEAYTAQVDHFNGVMSSNPQSSLPLHELLQDIEHNMAMNTYQRRCEEDGKFTIDLGHGLLEPAKHFSHLTFYFDTARKRSGAKPIDLSIMIVDDERPKEWYDRMIAVGFKDILGQQGYFFDCESALRALETGRYDVILSDLELGEGKMDGIEFVKKAYALQQRRGVAPRISVFSHNEKKLDEAERQIGRHSNTPRVFEQVNYRTKTDFSDTNFKFHVSFTLDAPTE